MTFTSGAHLIIEDQMVSRSGEIITAVNQTLVRHFDITHTTLQLECDSCPSGFVSTIHRSED
jgi:hypothetical protein